MLTADPKPLARGDVLVAFGYYWLVTRAVNTGSRLAVGIMSPLNAGLRLGATIEQVTPDVPPVPEAHGLYNCIGVKGGAKFSRALKLPVVSACVRTTILLLVAGWSRRPP